ncbi:MAG: hypothetical protein ACO1N1_20165, partial [Dyadobacter fermentans]
SNPRYPCEYGSLANYWFQPLTHPSVLPSFGSANIAGQKSEKQTFQEKKLHQKPEIPIFARH